MATSSECDLTTTAASKGASSHITPDRRKRAFRNLVSGVAEHLEKQEVNDICWQMDLPDFLQEKPALETLKWLVRQGKCSESDVQPLVQLLKDIHREDLAERVETFQKKFGHYCSVPEDSHHYSPHSSAAEMQAAHGTMFESVPNCTIAVQDDTPSGIAITKAQQETSTASHEDSCSENPLDGSTCSLASYATNVFLPSFTPLKPSGSYRRVSENSIPFTLESSSASSSLLEMPPPPVGQCPPPGLMWRFSSNSSSDHGIGQENMLFHSSNSDIMEPNVLAASQYQPRLRAHTMTHQRDIPWYCQSSEASLFTPMPVADQNFGSSNSMTILHQRHPYSRSSTGRLPMCRSMSQDYHKPLHKNHYLTLHRRHTFTPADRQERGTQCRAVQAPMDNSRVPEVSKELPQNQMCCAHLSTYQNCCKPHTHCGHLDYSVHPVSPSDQRLRCPSHYQSSVPTRHLLSECCSQRMLKRGWDSGEESMAKSAEHERPPQKNDHTAVNGCECLDHNSGPCSCIHKMCQFDNVQSSDAESESSVAVVSRNEEHNDNDCHLKRRNVSYAKKRYSVPVFQSQCLDIHKDVHSTESAQTHRQSLDVSALKRGSTCMSTSSGNASTSNRSLTSVSTLIGSATNIKSPVSSPPMIRNKGDAGTSMARVPPHSVATVSLTSMSKWRSVSGLLHSKPKPRLIEPNKLVWPIKRDKLNKYIYKHKTKLLKCKLNWELTSEHEIGPSPKLSLQLHPYGAEEDSNKFITAKVSIESRRCRLHSDTTIGFIISARESDPTSGAQIGKLREKYEQITKSFFYIKQFIDHQDLKNSPCDYIQVIASATLIMPSHH